MPSWRRRLQAEWVCVIQPALRALFDLTPEILTGIAFCILVFGLPVILLVLGSLI